MHGQVRLRSSDTGRFRDAFLDVKLPVRLSIVLRSRRDIGTYLSTRPIATQIGISLLRLSGLGRPPLQRHGSIRDHFSGLFLLSCPSCCNRA